MMIGSIVEGGEVIALGVPGPHAPRGTVFLARSPSGWHLTGVRVLVQPAGYWATERYAEWSPAQVADAWARFVALCR